MRLEFFYDLSSPWSYLAFTGIQPLAARHGAEIEWRPILVGGVFNAVNQELYAAREATLGNPRRRDYMKKDLRDWAKLRGVEINWPAFHPVSAVKPMRGCIVARQAGCLLPYSKAVYEAYWGRCEDISQDRALAAIAAAVGMDAAKFSADIQRQEVKDALRANTDELIQRGAFGSPTIYLDGDDMYFGNDRLPLVEARLAAAPEVRPA